MKVLPTVFGISSNTGRQKKTNIHGFITAFQNIGKGQVGTGTHIWFHITTYLKCTDAITATNTYKLRYGLVRYGMLQYVLVRYHMNIKT